MRCVDTGDRKKAEKENLAMKGTGKWRGGDMQHLAADSLWHDTTAASQYAHRHYRCDAG